MKPYNLTIRLDKDLKDLLMKMSKKTGRSMSEILRDALWRQLSSDEQLKSVRKYRGKLKWSGNLDEMRQEGH